MNNLLKFAMGMGVATVGSGTYGLLTNAYSDNNRGDWDWQYKGSAFRDRVGNFTLFSDNKSRYNDYLKGYDKTIGYNFDLSPFQANPKSTPLIAALDPINNSEQTTNYGNYYSKVGTQMGENEDTSFVDFVKGSTQLLSTQYSYTFNVAEVAAIEAVKDKEVLMGITNYKSNNQLGVLNNKSYITKLGDPNDRSIKKAGDNYALDKNANHTFIHSKVVQVTDSNGLEKVRFDSKPLGFGGEQKRGLDLILGLVGKSDPAWKKSDTYFETSHSVIVSETKQYLQGLKQGKSNIGREEGNRYVFSDDNLLREISRDISNVKQGGNVIIETASFEDGLTIKHPLIQSILETGKTNEILIVGGSENKRSMPDYLNSGKIKTAKRQIHRNIVIVEQKDETIAYVGNTSRFTDSNIGEVGVRISSKEFPKEIAFLKKQALMSEADPEGFMRQMATSGKMKRAGVHNELMRPIFDSGKDFKGFVFNNKKSHSESFELARYNASMRATGRFNSVVDPTDINTYETLLRGTKSDGQLNNEELRFAKAYDLAVNTPTMASRINEFFFIPMGLGRVYKEEKGIVPSIFGTIGALIDQAYLVNNPILPSNTQDGEDYFTTKTSLFQDLFENSAAGILASASSVAVYLTVGAPLKVMASEAIVKSQERLMDAASDNHAAAKIATGGNLNSNIGFKLGLVDRIANGNKTAFYDLDNPTFSLYWLDNYERHRGGSFFSATAQPFLMNKVSPYKIGSVGYVKLRSAINDYLNVLQSPADIELIDRTATTNHGVRRAINWNSETISVKSYVDAQGNMKPILIKDAVTAIRNSTGKGTTGPYSQAIIDEINTAINNKYTVKITNVSLERSMQLAKKTQAILNLMPMPWAWGIFNGRTMTDVSGPMVGNLLDIEGFTRHINASLNNQGFWGAANEYMEFSRTGTNATNPAFRIVNHMATATRSILAFNDRGGQSKADLEEIMKISDTYSSAETKIKVSNPKAIGELASGYKVINTDDFRANPADDLALKQLLSNEAEYQRHFKEMSGNRPGLNSISLGDEKLFQYANANRASTSLGFILNTLDNGGSYLGLKIASTKLAAAKYILGGLFIAQLGFTEYAQRGGASILATGIAQSRLNATSNHTAELSSTQFLSVKEITSYFGANADWTNVVGGLEAAVMLAGTSRWAWEHASTFSPEIQGKLFAGEAIIDLIDEVATELDPKTGKPVYRPMGASGYAGLEAELAVKDGPSKTKISAKIGGEEIAFNVERNPATKQIIGLKALTAKVSKNYTSFAVAIGLTMAAMQTARFVVSSVINTERQIMGSSVIGTYALAIPAVAIAATALADNVMHTVNAVTGKGYSNYKLTSGLVKGFTIGKGGFEVGILPSIQGLANLFGKGNATSAIATIGLMALVGGAYAFKLSPFQGDINGPKLDDTGLTAIAKLGSYSRQVLQRIQDIENNVTGNTNISEQVSPLEVNAALFSIALGKIINPITSSQKGSTAFVMAIQSPTPVFQYYSVLKKIVDTSGNSYTTVNLGLQGPPLFGFAPINVSLPIAFAMNAKSADGTSIKTGYFGSGIMLNENNKDSLNLADYFTVYSNVMLASSVALSVSNTLAKNHSFSRNQQILKSNGNLISSDSLLTRSVRGIRDRFASVARLPFEVAAQSLHIATGDLRMPTLRLRSAALVPAVFNAFIGAAFSNHMLDVFSNLSNNYKDKPKTQEGLDFGRIGTVAAITTAWFAQDYYRGTFAAARRLSKIEAELNIDPSKRFNHKDVDFVTRKLYASQTLQDGYRLVRGLKHSATNTIISMAKSIPFIGPALPNIGSRIGKGASLFAVGAFWNHFITDPSVGKINPQVAYGNIKEGEENRYTFGARRGYTVLFGGLAFAGLAGITNMTPRSFMLGDVDTDEVVEKYKKRLDIIADYEKQVSDFKAKGKGSLSLLQKANYWYQNVKASMEGKEVSTIIEEALHNNPIINFLNENKQLQETGILKDPRSEIRKATASAAKLSYDELSRMSVNEGDSLETLVKNNGAANVRKAVDLMSPSNTTKGKAINQGLNLNKSASMRINVNRYTSFGVAYAAFSFVAMGTNWMSQALGYKDFQDAFVGTDTNNDFKNAVVDSIKLVTGYDREYSYDITKGLAGPNLYNSRGEYLISPGSTRKGSINNALKNLNKMVLISAPNTFIGVEIGGITVRPDDTDQRVRGYFQLQSASQDFSSAMYSMSAVFGLQGLASKGFFKETLIANLRGIDDAEPKNQAQMRSMAADIITAVYSQPARRPKDRIKFTKPGQFTLEAMQTNKALSMSLNRRYKTLQALSFGSAEQLAMFTLLNNMNVAAPEMQNKFYKALRELADNDNGLGLGELNQNFFMGGRLKVIKSLGKFNNLNPFASTKVNEREMASDDAFMEMQSIALNDTTNQFFNSKSSIDKAGEFIKEAYESSPLMGLANVLPPLALIPLGILGISTLGLGLVSAFFNFGGSISANEVSKDNFKLYDQNAKFFDEGDWFSNNPIETSYINKDFTNISDSPHHVVANSKVKGQTSNKYIIIKRAGIVFNVGDAIDEPKLKQYTDQVDNLSANLSSKFISLFQEYAKEYGKEGNEYTANKAKLDAFYDKLEESRPATSLPNETAEATREKRVLRSKARSFTPIMADYSVDTASIEYNHTSHKITDHILDTFTQKQALDAYLEGQYLAFHEQGSVLNREDFVNKYYKDITYDDILKTKTNEFISNKGLNIFGKDRHASMTHSINLLSEVYASKYDVIIDAYFDAIDESLDNVFGNKLTAPDNVFTKFAPTGLNAIETIDEGYVRKLSVDNRMQLKAQLRDRMTNRISNIMQTKRTGIAAAVDKMLTIVGAGGRVKDNLNRIALEAGQEAIEVVKQVRTYGGNMFAGQGGQVEDELIKEVTKQAELNILNKTNQGLKGNMPTGPMPDNVKTMAGLNVLDALSRVGNWVGNMFQMTQFVSINLLTLRAGASIASSNTHEREKEMAREEMAQEAYNNLFAAMFWGSIMSSDKFKQYGYPIAGGAIAGYLGYEILFKGNLLGASITGTGLAALGAFIFKGSKTWGLSLGVAGITMIGRGVLENSSQALSSISPEVGAFISKGLDSMNDGGQNAARFVQDNARFLNVAGGATLGILSAINAAKNKSIGNILHAAASFSIMALGIADIVDELRTNGRDNKIEAASRVALGGISNLLFSGYSKEIGKTVASLYSNHLAKYITATATQASKHAVVQKITGAAIKQAAKAVALRTVVTGLGTSLATFFANPWVGAASTVLTLAQIALIFLAPEATDDVTSNITNLPTQLLGAPGSFLMKPSNQIYNEKRYRDNDLRNPIFQGTVNDALKEQWLAQIDTLDDPTGRKTAGKNVISFDAPLIGYTATSEGYGPGSPTPVQDFALAIRGKAYNQLVTGRQYWNSRMSDKLNHQQVVNNMKTADKLQIQAWEKTVKNIVDNQNRKITSKPPTSAKQIIAIKEDGLNTLAEVSEKISHMKQNIKDMNNKDNLALQIKGVKTQQDKDIHKTSYTKTAVNIKKTVNNTGQAIIEFNQGSAKDAEQVAIQHYNIVGNNYRVEQNNIKPIV